MLESTHSAFPCSQSSVTSLPGQVVMCRAALRTTNSSEPHPQAEEGRFISWLLSSCPVCDLKPRAWLSATAQHAQQPPSDLGREL